jgi:hypothetical protein
MMKRFLRLEWEAIAGIIAAVAALVLHLLHIVESDVLLVIAVVLMAGLFMRDVRRGGTLERLEELAAESSRRLEALSASVRPPDAILVGPGQLRAASEDFSRRAQGEMTWFHVCLLMFKPQPLFDTLLKPAIENPKVKSIQFVLDGSQKVVWEKEVAPKVAACRDGHKVREPRWTSIQENVSAIISEVAPGGATECLLSFWGEPFMARDAGKDIPRYIFHVQGHSELVSRLLELERRYRLGA